MKATNESPKTEGKIFAEPEGGENEDAERSSTQVAIPAGDMVQYDMLVRDGCQAAGPG